MAHVVDPFQAKQVGVHERLNRWQWIGIWILPADVEQLPRFRIGDVASVQSSENQREVDPGESASPNVAHRVTTRFNKKAFLVQFPADIALSEDGKITLG